LTTCGKNVQKNFKCTPDHLKKKFSAKIRQIFFFELKILSKETLHFVLEAGKKDWFYWATRNTGQPRKEYEN
jgi:hypothetical protein